MAAQTKAAQIKKVGVIGSGQMGNGIAHVAALAGLDVVLNDISADRLKSGMATINGNLSRQVAKKIITEDARKKALERIVSSETMDGFADCDLSGVSGLDTVRRGGPAEPQ